jgi:hypothetical protein
MPGNDYLLLHSQKKQIIASAIGAGLNASDFVWEERDSKLTSSQQASVLIHRATAYEFFFDFSAGYSKWRLSYTPAETTVNGVTEVRTLEDVIKIAGKWMTWLAREIEAQDYLAIAMQARPFLQLDESDRDEVLQDHERRQILVALAAIEKHLLSKAEVDKEHHTWISRQFALLKIEASRADRTAFRYMVYSALLSIGLTVLGTDGARDLLALGAMEFNNILLVSHSMLFHAENHLPIDPRKDVVS